MMRKMFALSLVATMLSGLTMVAATQPAEARGNCGNNDFQSNRFSNTRSANLYNNGYLSSRYNNGLGLGRGNRGLARLDRQQDKEARKAARQAVKRQMQAAGIPFGRNATAFNNGFAPPILSNVNNPSAFNNAAFNNGVCNQSANAAYSQGFNDGVATANNGFVNNNNGLFNNGLFNNGGYGLNGLNGLNTGGGVSGFLGRMINGF